MSRGTFPGFKGTQFGSAEVFISNEANGPSGIFYSHEYTEKGRADLIDAAEHYVKKQTEDDAVRRLALVLLWDGGPSHDTYHRGGEDRWIIHAKDFITRARRLYGALEMGERELKGRDIVDTKRVSRNDPVVPEWTPESSLAEEFKDVSDREGVAEFRENVALALHNLLCDHNEDESEYAPPPGEHSRYQRHADTLIALIGKEYR